MVVVAADSAADSVVVAADSVVADSVVVVAADSAKKCSSVSMKLLEAKNQRFFLPQQSIVLMALELHCLQLLFPHIKSPAHSESLSQSPSPSLQGKLELQQNASFLPGLQSRCSVKLT